MANYQLLSRSFPVTNQGLRVQDNRQAERHPTSKLPQRERASRKEKIELTTAVIALVTALVGGLFAYNRNQAANTSDSRSSILEQQLGQTNEQLNEANAQNRQLKTNLASDGAQIAALTKRLATTSTTSGGTPPTTSVPTPATEVAVWHKGPLTLNQGQQADLDAPQTDPQWGILTDDGNDNPDIVWNRDGNGELDVTHTGTGVQLVLLSSTATGTDPCISAPGYDSLAIPSEKITVGARMCVFTGEQRYSLITVTSERADASLITFTVTTFKKPTD